MKDESDGAQMLGIAMVMVGLFLFVASVCFAVADLWDA